MSWRQALLDASFEYAWREQMDDVPPARTFERAGLHALVSRDPVIAADERWHVSGSRPGRAPRWEDLADPAHELRPGVPIASAIPLPSQRVNVHPDTLHAWELRDEYLIAEWRRNARPDRPRWASGC